MATRTALLYSGEDQSPVVDYTDTVIWEESEFGTRANVGEGSASTVVIRDPLGETGNSLNLPAGLTFKTLPAKSLFIIRVGSDFLFRGRIGIKNYSRDDQHVERYRQVECQLHDTNWDLDHISVHAYPRPAETDKQRAQGLIASYLSGSPRRTTDLNGSNFISASNTVTLPAQTYNRTSPLEILREVAISANKQFFVTGDSQGGGSLFWDGNDSTAYACTLSISDRQSEVNYTTVFPPIWNVGPASTEDGSELISAVRLFYGAGEDKYVDVSDPVIASQYGYAAENLSDDTALSIAVATNRANAILNHRQYEDKTVNVTIGPLTDAQVVLVKHGQIINVKARAITYADDQAYPMRIGQCRFTTPVPGTWFAHLQLGRPWKMQPYSKGTKPTFNPACVDFAGAVSLGSNANNDGLNYPAGVVTGPNAERVAMSVAQSAAIGQSIVIIAGHSHNANPEWGVWDDAGNTYTNVAEHRKTISGDQPRVGIWYTTVTSLLSAGQKIYFECDVGASALSTLETDDKAISAYLFNGTILSGSESGTGSGFNAAPTVAVGGTSGLLVAGLIAKADTADTFSDDADFTAFTQAVSSSSQSCKVVGGWRIGDTGGETWASTISQSRDWAMVGAIFTVTECTPDTPAVGSESDDGTSSEPAHKDHTHEARTIVRKNSTGSEFTRRRVNLIEGSNVTLTVTDDSANNEIDVTIASTGGAAGEDLANVYIGSLSPNGFTSITSALAANRAYLWKFSPRVDVTVTTARWHCHTSNGNLDFGIYNADRSSLLASTGSFASPGTGARSQAFSGAASVALDAGTIYYFAMTVSSTTFRCPVWVPTGAFTTGYETMGREESALPLPSSIASVDAWEDGFTFPLFSFT